MPKLRISILVLCFFLVSPFSADAQNAADEEVGLVYRKEAVGGLLLHTRGFGFHFRYGIQKTYLNKLYDVEDVKAVNCWSYEESLFLARQNYRETY